jgi:hypothetical protein
MIKPHTISTQMWLETEDDNLGFNGSYVEFRVVVDSINGFWVENEDEIVLIISGTAYYIESNQDLLIFLKQYFNPLTL